MSFEEYLKEVTVGNIVMHNQKIVLCKYNMSWPILFQEEAKKIRNVLGITALKIEHVGSTSVPHLCAKPVIDILLIVKNSADENTYVMQLEGAGYTIRIRESKWFEHRMFKGKSPDVNLHVFSKKCEEAERMLAFRDWLRENEEDRDLYAKTKQRLVERTWKHVQEYADAKTEVIQEIMGRII